MHSILVGTAAFVLLSPFGLAEGQSTVPTTGDSTVRIERVVNIARLRYTDAGGGGGGDSAQVVLTVATPIPAPPTALGQQLVITTASGVVNARVGESVPWNVSLRNSGTVALRNIVIYVRIPDGSRFAPGSVINSDSSKLAGQELRIYVAGPLAPGATWMVRYASTVLTRMASTLAQSAFASAEGGLVSSNTASAAVPVHEGFALETRTLLGRVLLVGDGTESAVSGARVWSEDGQVITADRQGRFSFRDLGSGTHTIRLDELSLPAGVQLMPGDQGIVTIHADGWTTPRVTFRVVMSKRTVDTAGSAQDNSHIRAQPAVESEPVDLGPQTRTGISSPSDGAVLASRRIYVGVQGEPGAEATLYDGDALVRTAVLRVDGHADFVAVELQPGPHTLRTVMRGVRIETDSIHVHRSGAPATFEYAAPLSVRIDGGPVTVRMRVLDEWGVPVVDVPQVSIALRGAVLDGDDSDSSSVGEQRQVDPLGNLTIVLRTTRREPGDGIVSLSSGPAHREFRLTILPSARRPMIVGTGQFGVGATRSAFGTLAAQGAVGGDASLRLSYDSRRSLADTSWFARGYDPFDESRLPTYGDGSTRSLLTTGTGQFSARLERGLDWIEFGDVHTQFLGGAGGGYQRSLTGVSTRVGMGGIVFSGFGSMTTQALTQRQLRGDGTSGPYVLANGIRPGTERLAVEVRDRENASRVLSRNELITVADYDIDYIAGAVVLRRPIPAADAYGNPVYLVATLEQRTGGDAHLVAGGRVETDAARWLSRGSLDTLRLGATVVRDGTATGVTGSGVASLVSTDLRFARRGLALGGEFLRSNVGDSTAMATRLDGRWALANDHLRLSGGWMQVGRGFSSAIDPRLATAQREGRVGAEFRSAAGTSISLSHTAQAFDAYNVERRTTALGAEERVAGRRFSQQIALTAQQSGGADAHADNVLRGKASFEITPKIELWLDADHSVNGTPRANFIGLGASYQLAPQARLIASHRWMTFAGDSGAATVSSLGVQTTELLGARVRGSVERTDGARVSHAAILGWDQRLALAGGWSAAGMLERRFGLERIPISEFERALPFPQAERDQWAAAVKIDWLPADDRARFSVQNEVHEGADRRGYRFRLAGDAPLGSDAALIMLHDWSFDRGAAVAQGSRRSDRSLLGFALRPASHNSVDALVKIEWLRSPDMIAGIQSVPTTGGSDSRRFIGSAEGIWHASEQVEIAVRIATRLRVSAALDSGAPPVSAHAQFLGVRAERAFGRRFRMRVDGHVLSERESSGTMWNVTPSLVTRFGPMFELDVGYRLGALRDVDFGPNGDQGVYALFGVHFTERSIAGVGAYWRERVR